ncbi:ferritin-like domain-containing protein [Streptomyces oryzae]|uniref:Ferritin-like domain-containing protein n=1 Tax=Streptomyces oryzae TaxID=1434886 RepID=A0ABS3X4S6_9ACTN|nr:ferritin-like domain-containing protein [Streptomyces oryzae]MBO8190376.1 ferritin-like domain-containing protein [Streptomyces oryzae]
MLSARSLFQEILDNDESFRLFCSIAASGEAQGGWENGRIAVLVPETQRHLAPKIVRHGADEDKHGRIFMALLNKRGLEAAEIPDDTDYTMILEGLGIGLAHEKLRRDEPLTEYDVLTYLAHSRVTEQRASEEMILLKKVAGDHPELGRAVKMISKDEDNHLAYCHEELLHLARAGHAGTIRELLRESALAEIKVYRDVSLAVMSRMARILGWSGAKYGLVALGIHGRYVWERLGGWRRMVTLRMPERRNALGTGRPDAAPEYA